MAEWSVTPNEGVSIEQATGEITFPPNTGSTDITYTVSYTSDTNCTANTTYTVPACPTSYICDYYFFMFNGSDSNGVNGITPYPCWDAMAVFYYSDMVSQDIRVWLTYGLTFEDMVNVDDVRIISKEVNYGNNNYRNRLTINELGNQIEIIYDGTVIPKGVPEFYDYVDIVCSIYDEALSKNVELTLNLSFYHYPY